MAGLRGALLSVLAGTLLLVSVRGWTLNPDDHLKLQSGEEWEYPFPSTDDVVEGEATEVITSDTLPFGLQYWNSAPTWARAPSPLASEPAAWDSEPAAWDSEPAAWASESAPRDSEPPPCARGLNFVCIEAGFEITPSVPLSDVKVLGVWELTPVLDSSALCGYEVNLLLNTVTIPFTGCHVKQNVDGHSVQLLYTNKLGHTQVSTASCEFGASPRAGGSFDCPYQRPVIPAAPTVMSPPPPPTTAAPTTATSTSAPTTMPVTTPLALSGIAHNCQVPSAQRLPCGPSGISAADCSNMGCCVGRAPSACYYPVNECTADRHFVFSIRHDSANIPVDPSKLLIPGHPKCKPLVVSSKVAIFKFKITECGVTSYEVGNTQIYLAEVQTVVRTLNLKYGLITRTDPLRYLIECRYGKMGSNLLASVGYMVKRPSSSVPSTVEGMGRYGVELKISKNNSYASYYSTYHLPLQVLLGKPLYLELNIKSAKPDAVILVNYCVAYPHSASNALVLTYDGCANPNDPHVSILKVVDLPENRKQRRFMVKAFQFMDQRTNAYLDEEIYFMCSTEVCRTSEKSCEERCFDGKVV